MRPLVLPALTALACLTVSGVALVALAAPDPAPTKPRSPGEVTSPAPSPDVITAGRRAFVDVARVLQSPRCVNCHPSGDAPLQGDHLRPHAMNVSRVGVDAGLACGTCHQDRNSEAVGVPNGPPGAPRWGLPPRDMPLVFQGMTIRALCEQMKNPATNGHKDFEALHAHVDHDPLVLWGWAPGGKRTLPPLSHADFVLAFDTWLASAGACP